MDRHRSSFVLAVVASLVGASACSRTEDGAEQSNSATSKHHGIDAQVTNEGELTLVRKGVHEAWRTSLPTGRDDPFCFSRGLCVSGQVWIPTARGEISVFRYVDGSNVGRIRLEFVPVSGLCQIESSVYVGGVEGQLAKIDIESRTVLWSKEITAEEITSLTHCGDSLFLASQRGSLFKVRVRDGAVTKELRVFDSDLTPDCIVFDGFLVAFARNEIARINCADMAVVWRSQIKDIETSKTIPGPQVAISNVVLAHKKLYAVTLVRHGKRSESIVEFDSNSGTSRLVFEHRNLTSNACVTPKGLLLMATDGVILLDRDGTRLWRQTISDLQGDLVCIGEAYVCATGREIVVGSVITGEVIHRRSGVVSPIQLFAGEHGIVVVGRTGQVVSLSWK